MKNNCTCTNKYTCGFCLSRLFMLNHIVYKVCVKDYEKLAQLPTLTEFLCNLDCKTKFYFNPHKNVVNYVAFT